MSLQTFVPPALGLGLPGQKYDSGPHRATSYVLASTAPADGQAKNIVGNVFTLAGEGKAAMGGTGRVLGLLGTPHVYAAPALEAGLALPNGQAGEIISFGPVLVVTENEAAPGDAAVYNTATGAISALAAGAQMPEGFAAVPDAEFILFSAAAGGLAVLNLK